MLDEGETIRTVLPLPEDEDSWGALSVVFATATPVANTMAEVHTMMRYLQPRRLEALGLQQFDAWAATFGESVTALPVDAF